MTVATHSIKAFSEIQSEVCDTTLRVMSVLVVPALAISLTRALDVGWLPQFSAQVGAALIIWTIALFRARFTYVVRANTIVFLLFWLGWIGQVFTGTPTSLVFYVSASAMATVFYGARGGVAAIVFSVALTASTFFGMKYGFYDLPRPIPALAVTTWLARIASVVIAAAGPVISLVQFRASLLKELRQAEAASAAKSTFLAMMSHELRTPMTAIIGIAEMLEQESMPASQAEKVSLVASSGKSLLTLLNDLLDFAKIEAAQMSVDVAAFSLDDVLENVRGLFAPLAAEKGLSLRVDRASGQDAFLGDAARICQIIRNLVGNAIKFTEEGHVTIAVSQKPRTDGKLALEIVVSDTGPGIAAADQTRLFNPFVQGESLRSRRHGGTGLGLAISRSLARLMDGELSVTSEAGRGSNFILSVPVEVAIDTPTRAAQSRPMSAARYCLRVLLAEDNQALRYLIQGMLTNRGHKVDCVEDGAKALAAAQARLYDVVVMDMHMPVMDGATATRAIRSLPTLVARLPIIALTAGLTVDERAAYIAAGVDQIVAKPCDWETLFAAIEGRGRAFSQLIEPEPAQPTEDFLDEKILSGLESAVGAAQVAQIMVTVRENLGTYHLRIKDAFATRDLTAARKAGHALKGTSRQFGAPELGRIGEKIEAASSTASDLQDALLQIAPALARFDAAIAARVAVKPESP